MPAKTQQNGAASVHAELVASGPHSAPISGGTLEVTEDGQIAVVADAQRDTITLVDLTHAQPPVVIKLEEGDEPGRIALAKNGYAYVVLRQANAIAAVHLASRSVVQRKQVCREPRGIAVSNPLNSVYVACSTGELVTLSAAGLYELRRVFVASDLRDVMLTPTGLWITLFRSAELLQVSLEGTLLATTKLPAQHLLNATVSGLVPFVPSVAWRLRPMAVGGALLIHQRALDGPLPPVGNLTSPGYGSGGCKGSGVVQAVASVVPATGTAKIGRTLLQLPLAIDGDVSPDGKLAAFVSAGVGAVGVLPIGDLAQGMEVLMQNPCPHMPVAPIDQAVALAFLPNGDLLVQTRKPSLVVLHAAQNFTAPGTVIALQGAPVLDAALGLFHRTTKVGLACASCHPDGREDGRAWQFVKAGVVVPLRTQTLTGGLSATGPYRWEGDFANLGQLISTLFEKRMGGDPLNPHQVQAIAEWIESLPTPAGTAGIDVAAAAKGKALYNSTALGCSGCHSGPKMTNSETMSIGMCEMWQVPSLLGVSARLPLMHDGCAKMLKATLGPCAGESHNFKGKLNASDETALLAYLATL